MSTYVLLQMLVYRCGVPRRYTVTLAPLLDFAALWYLVVVVFRVNEGGLVSTPVTSQSPPLLLSEADCQTLIPTAWVGGKRQSMKRSGP